VLRALTRVLGAAVLAAVAAAGLLAAVAAWRIARYEQVDDPAALARKAGELAWMAEAPRAGAPRPNVVLILFDDLGLGDLGASGARALATPRLDALAAEGMVLSQYAAPAPVCTPSRAGLLTGRWPIRTTLAHVLFPSGHPLDRWQRARGLPVRLPSDEITLADGLRAGGYATAAIGKWHLGDHAPSRPRDLGFDHWFGVLHSNDMAPLPLWRNDEIVAPHPLDQTTLTPLYTDEAVRFMERHRERPFFVYLAHNFPHVPLHATPGQAGRSEAGLYGDVVADLDRSTGEILDALDRLGLAENTLVIATSDNGPWFQGSARGLRGRKVEPFEGGQRVPFLARWPAGIRGGSRSDAVASGVDLLPTLLALAGVPLPRDRAIDGVDLGPLLAGRGPPPERPLFYYAERELRAVRLGRWKRFERQGIAYPALSGLPFAPLFPQGPWLFDLARDPDESYDVHEREAEVFEQIGRVAEAHRAELAANPRGWK
jgi:arylsulfatase A-like enzyme